MRDKCFLKIQRFYDKTSLAYCIKTSEFEFIINYLHFVIVHENPCQPINFSCLAIMSKKDFQWVPTYLLRGKININNANVMTE